MLGRPYVVDLMRQTGRVGVIGSIRTDRELFAEQAFVARVSRRFTGFDGQTSFCLE